MNHGLTRNRPFNVSLRCLSTALCVARRSAVLARRLGLRLGGPPPEALLPVAEPLGEVAESS